MRTALLAVFLSPCLYTYAQSKDTVRTYFDPLKRKLKEEYTVSMRQGIPRIDGPYKSYYLNGNPKVVGAFVEGNRSGLFLEYDQNGDLMRRINYLGGERHGMVEVFSEGKEVQRARYDHNLLIDSIRSFSADGILKSEAYFVEGKPDGRVREFYPSGALHKEIRYKRQKPNGMAITYYENGSPMVKAHFDDGILTRFYKTYYPNGRPETISTIEKDQIDGTIKHYDSLGNLLLEAAFRNGRLHGANIAYYPDGVCRHRFTYQNGARTGVNLSYYPDGQLHTRERCLLEGRVALVDTFDPGEVLRSKKTYKDGKPEKTWTFFAEDGKTVRFKENYEKGRLHGVRTIYYPSGRKKREETYRFGLITGPVKSYYESGKLRSETAYHANRRQGPYIAYYPDGAVEEKGAYWFNKKKGIWTTYDEAGNLIATHNYDKKEDPADSLSHR